MTLPPDGMAFYQRVHSISSALRPAQPSWAAHARANAPYQPLPEWRLPGC